MVGIDINELGHLKIASCLWRAPIVTRNNIILDLIQKKHQDIALM